MARQAGVSTSLPGRLLSGLLCGADPLGLVGERRERHELDASAGAKP
jgi:hypothetical protein